MTRAAASDPGPSPAEAVPLDERKPGFWRRRLILPIRAQLTQGATPKELSRAVACGVLCGIFPILGTTTIVSTAVGMAFRLNQTVIQSLHWIIYPLHLLLIPVYIRGGELLFGAPRLPFSIPVALKVFLNSPAEFFSQFGMACVHCIAAWTVTSPFLAVLIIVTSRPLIERASRHLTQPAPELT